MSDGFFAGAYGGDAGKLPPQARLECKICWHVYDPDQGDEAGQIPAGTAFADLPPHWRCPECDSPKSGFLLLNE